MLSTSFRNTLIASTLLVGASLLASTAALAADPAPVGGSVSGTIEPISTITFTAPGSAATLTPGATSVNFPMGSLAITNNDPDGWELDVASTNGGFLRFTHDSTDYDITYEALTVAAIAGGTVEPFTPTVGAKGTTTTPLVDAVYAGDVANGVTGVAVSATLPSVADTLPAGTYSDTITFTLTSKL